MFGLDSRLRGNDSDGLDKPYLYLFNNAKNTAPTISILRQI